MKWNWQRKEWPNFVWEKEALEEFEQAFLKKAGILLGASKHLNTNNKKLFMSQMITDEAIKTSEIEGEYLNRESVQSSVRKHFGLASLNQKILPAEAGISEMMIDVYKTFNQSLSHQMLFRWHKMLLGNRRDILDIGRYRTHEDPMQIVSGNLSKPKVCFEAPPSKKIKNEMNQFIYWYQTEIYKDKKKSSALTKAGLAHLYFVCIHPFEDGNGRIGRAISEKILSHCIGQPSLIALSQVIQKHRKDYYDALERNNKNVEVTSWLQYFSKTILEAQNYSLKILEFILQKTRLYDEFNEKLNERQKKVIDRIFEEGVEGFKGGLSAENYITITKTSRATATRDLQDLLNKRVMKKTGELKSTRYFLNLD